jgi:3-dehydrosphinganine reductase
MVDSRLVSKQPFKGKAAVVCGSSKGIGKETARLIVQLGGSVCLIARGEQTLKETATELDGLRISDGQFVDSFACDASDFDAIKMVLDAYVEQRGTPDYLINVVGYAYPQYFEKLALADFKKNLEINYYGQLAPTLVLLPYFLEAKGGHVAFVSSISGFLGTMGYATYAPTKFALVGLAEVLRHEMKPNNINVSILYPPDTDTPGFELENQTKPPETAMLSETAKLLTPDKVAEAFIKGLLKRRFHIIVGEGHWIWPVKRIFPSLVNLIIDQDYAKARKKLGK